jgi:peptide/nickel transport system ATP-binding protein
MATIEPAGGGEKAMTTPLLRVEGLTTELVLGDLRFPVVDDLTFTIAPGETLGVVGESGCGKSMMALSLLGIAPNPPAIVSSGVAYFDGVDLLALDPARLRRLRGNRIAMIFQEPMTALNPLMSIGKQIAEVCRRHLGHSPAQAKARAIELLERVRIPDAKARVSDYPHQLSGGMRQRAMIAMALACDPVLLIADEPTTALDVTIQAQLLELISDLQEKTGMAMLLITHDLGVIAEMADRVLVMYAGRKVEEAPVVELFGYSAHPYTSGLMASVPQLGSSFLEEVSALQEIPGRVPAPAELPAGCAFAPRCASADKRCRVDRPELDEISVKHQAACWHPNKRNVAASNPTAGSNV